MDNHKVKINLLEPNSFAQAASKALILFKKLLLAMEIEMAKQQLDNLLVACKRVRNTMNGEINSESWNQATIFGIMCLGLLNYADIYENTHYENWAITNKKIEKVWSLLIDSTERLEFVFVYFQNDIVSWALKCLYELEGQFDIAFGPGVYLSPEIINRNCRCSICGNDFRSCPHIINNIYDGVICKIIPHKVELRSCNIVLVPKDRRCRIWPWNKKQSKDPKYLFSFESCALTNFILDDF